MQKKSQVAFEFLMTYGWAILSVMVALGVLAYFGILSPSRSLPDRCIFANGVNCQDYLLTVNAVNVSLLNGAGQSLYSFSIAPDGFTGSCKPDSTSPITLAPDTKVVANCTISSPTLISGKKGKVRFTVTFKKIVNGFNQVSLGEVYATVQ